MMEPGDEEDRSIELPAVDTCILRRVVDYCSHYAHASENPDWFMPFIEGLDLSQAQDLQDASVYMGIHGLRLLC